MAASVGGSREDLGYGLPQPGPRGRFGVRQGVVVAGSGQSGRFKQVGKGIRPWTVLETGDGQVSGLATEITPEAFCATLTERLATDVEARSILPPTCI